MTLLGFRFNQQTRGGETIYRTARIVTHDQLMRMIELWRGGNDTKTIAEQVCLPEHEVANRLPGLREQFRSVGVR